MWTARAAKVQLESAAFSAPQCGGWPGIKRKDRTGRHRDLTAIGREWPERCLRKRPLSTELDTRSAAFQQCINPACAATFGVDEAHFACAKCGDLLDVVYQWDKLPVPRRLADFEAKWALRHDPLAFSGVWRFHELLPFASGREIVTIGEGQTLLQKADKVGRYVGLDPGSLWLQYEGMNPSGSFKDNGMTAAFTHARMVSARRVACASTGNTSAALAVYCSATNLGFRAIIFIGTGKIAYGKLAQALDHGALTIQIVGDFDDAMQRVRQVADRLGIYLMNSINPFRLEGQKAIIFRVLEGLRWEVPDWIVVPGGNLGNSSAFGKALIELKYLGLISRVPRLAVINASGAQTLNELVGSRGLRWRNGLPEMDKVSAYYDELDSEKIKASTVASAIEINRPVNLKKCLRALEFCERCRQHGIRSGDHGCEGPGRRRRSWLRAGQRRQCRRRQAAA